jgi:hypothetical protein
MIELLRVAAIAFLTCCALGGCAVTNQLHSELNYDGDALDSAKLAAGGIGVLTPAAPTGQESDKQLLGDSLGTALQSGVAEAHVVPLAEMLSAINRAGLASGYSAMLDGYTNTGILDRDRLHDVGAAAHVRYLAKLNLGSFNQASDRRLAIAGIRMFDTWRSTIRVHLEIWDSATGEVAWAGNEELVFAREGVKERPVTFRQVAALAATNLVNKIGASGSETLDAAPTAVAANTGEPHRERR